DVGDVRPRDDETRLATLHRHLVVLQVHHFAEDATGRQHLVPALQRGQQLAMALLLLLLRTEDQEIDDGEHRRQLEHEPPGGWPPWPEGVKSTAYMGMVSPIECSGAAIRRPTAGKSRRGSRRASPR